MAAPETRPVRLLRLSFIGLVSVTGIGVLSTRLVWHPLLGPVVTGLVSGVLLAATLIVGTVYFLVKKRRDDARLDQLTLDARDR
ncbi:MAG: hypothetical protein H0X36_00690 [Sphingomonadaceae bacterium]|nr:hypothetical protein [Sphingomonadaceae bacterium]